MKIPQHILEKITGSTENYEKGFRDGWDACSLDIEATLETYLKREGDLREDIKEFEHNQKIDEAIIKQLKAQLRTQLMEEQEPSDKSQEAAHYNYLDDKNSELKAQLEIAMEALNEIEKKCYTDDSIAWTLANNAIEKLEVD